MKVGGIQSRRKYTIGTCSSYGHFSCTAFVFIVSAVEIAKPPDYVISNK
jgi:hypothetical protein